MYSAFLNQNIWTCQYFYFGYFTFHFSLFLLFTHAMQMAMSKVVFINCLRLSHQRMSSNISTHVSLRHLMPIFTYCLSVFILFNANVYSLNRSAFIHSLIFNNYFFTSFFLCRVPFLFIFLCLQKYFLPKLRSKNDVFGSMPTLKNALKHSPQKCQNF